MANVARRLDQLERAIGRMGRHVCGLCHGFPIVAVHVMWSERPNRAGYGKTGERFLHEGHQDHVTDDLRCCRCGVKARETHLMTIAGIGPAPRGRRICQV